MPGPKGLDGFLERDLREPPSVLQFRWDLEIQLREQIREAIEKCAMRSSLRPSDRHDTSAPSDGRAIATVPSNGP